MNDEKVTTLEDVAAAAKALEAAMNSYPRELQIDIDRMQYIGLGVHGKTRLFQLRLRTNDQVYP